MKQLSLLIFFILITNNGFSCSCKYGGNFIQSAKKSEFVVKARIIAQYYHTSKGKRFKSFEDYFNSENIDISDFPDSRRFSIEIEILDLIKGKESTRKVEIFGSDGVDCRESLHNLKVGDVYLLNMYIISQTNNYAIGGCSENIIEYNSAENKVFGMIKGKRQRKARKYDYNWIVKKIK